MSLWPAVWSLLAAWIICYGLAVAAAFTLPNDLPRGLIVFLLLILGGVLLFTFIGFTIAAAVQEVVR